MKDVLAFLAETPTLNLATIGLDGKPKNRPFMFAMEKDGQLWFCTSTEKDVYRQLQACPYLEFTASSPSYSWIRLSGKAHFADNRAIKQHILDSYPMIRSIYKTADNPQFATFAVAEARAVIADFSGDPPKEYIL